MTPQPWQPTAAYLYVLQLGPSGIAWEYLRRHPGYRSADDTSQWGLSFREDPDLDARQARPVWCIGNHPHVQLVPLTDPVAQVFDLWAVPGSKTLVHDGEALWLHGVSGRELVALRLAPEVEDGHPFAYALPAGVDQRRCHFTLETALALMQRPAPTTPTALTRPARATLMHMRALQALDGLEAGASQRQIASALFGADRVAAEWQPDSELRAHVRYLIQRGRSFRDGGYRELLH